MNFLLLFIIGGFLFVAIKYLSMHVDTKYASIVAAFPLGLLTGLMISDGKIFDYSLNYSKNIFILLLASITQYICLKFKFNRYLTLALSFIIWLLLNSLNVFIF